MKRTTVVASLLETEKDVEMIEKAYEDLRVNDQNRPKRYARARGEGSKDPLAAVWMNIIIEDNGDREIILSAGYRYVGKDAMFVKPEEYYDIIMQM